MAISVFDLFKVGIGPSSSHTVGPMRAADAFLALLRKKGFLEKVKAVKVVLMGSLAATGKGHGTDKAVLLGLMGERPETIDPDIVDASVERIERTHELKLGGVVTVPFDPARDIAFEPQIVPPFHTNAMDIEVHGDEGVLYKRRYYSVGGGFVVAATEEDPDVPVTKKTYRDGEVELPYPFKSGDELLAMAKKHQKSIVEMVRANEAAFSPGKDIDAELDHIWAVMQACIDRGFRESEPLAGPFKVARRAKQLREELLAAGDDPLVVLDWVNAYAIAVSEENAAGGRVVTAPTNGAAGIVPAVIEYYLKHVPGATQGCVRTFLLTAGAIGMLFKENASISGAEVGCQGEVGVACSMAAGGLAAVLGGTPEQIENAAEIGMEHNLGLTCDPVAGQVQIPCIERNAVGAVKAINAARMAMRGNGQHYISLDKVMKTMLETGRDMQSKYKETSLGGLAVSIVEC